MEMNSDLSNPYLRSGPKLQQPPKSGEIDGQELGKHGITAGASHGNGNTH